MTLTKQELFENIYHATFNTLSKHVFFKVASLEDAQDIVQNVYAQYYISVIQKNKSIENPQAYLMSMATNELALYYKSKATQAVLLSEDEYNVFENIPDDTDLALEIIEKSTVEMIYKQIRNLSPLDQKIIGGRFRYNLTFAEIAFQLEVSENTIKTRYYRAIQTLKDKLDQK